MHNTNPPVVPNATKERDEEVITEVEGAITEFRGSEPRSATMLETQVCLRLASVSSSRMYHLQEFVRRVVYINRAARASQTTGQRELPDWGSIQLKTRPVSNLRGKENSGPVNYCH